MKRVAVFVLALFVVLSLAACNRDNDGKKSGTNSKTTDKEQLENATVDSFEELDGEIESEHSEEVEDSHSESAYDSSSNGSDGAHPPIDTKPNDGVEQTESEAVSDSDQNESATHKPSVETKPDSNGGAEDTESEGIPDTVPDESDTISDLVEDPVVIRPDPNEGADGTWASAFAFYSGLINDMGATVQGVIDSNNKKLETEDLDGYFFHSDYILVSYLPFLSVNIGFTSNVTDTVSPYNVTTTYLLWGYNDVSFIVNSSGNYTITYTEVDSNNSALVYNHREELVYDRESNGMRYHHCKDGKTLELLEFISLGDDRYALQSLTERAIVSYKNGKTEKVVYGRNIFYTDWETKEPTSQSLLHDAVKDSIFGKTTLDESWVYENKESLEETYVYDGTSLTVGGLDKVTDWETNEVTYVEREPVVITAQ